MRKPAIKHQRWLATVAVAAGLSLAVSACGSTENSDEPGAENSGTAKSTLTVGWNQPFYAYNNATSNGNNAANANIQYLMNGNFWYYDAEANLLKDETFGTYEKISDDPLTVKYTVADETTWSDGTPVDAVDLLLQWAAQSGNVNTISPDKVKTDEATGLPLNTKEEVYFDTSSPGLELVTELPEISDDGKSLTLVYDEVFADWELDMTVSVPAHVVAEKALGVSDPTEAKAALVKAITDKDKAALVKVSSFWNTGFDYTELPEDPDLYLSNGAYLMTELKEGDSVTLEKNPDYEGKFEPSIERIIVRFNEDPVAQVQALQNGELSLFQPQVTEDVIDTAESLENVEIDSGVESTYEHLDLVVNNGGPFDPATYDGDEETALKVRQAFLKAVPRDEIVTKLIKPIQPDAEPRDSFLVTVGAPGYDEIVADNGSDAYAEADVEAAKKLLREAGVETPIKVRVMYADKNTRREQEFQIMQPAMARAGFDLVDGKNPNWSEKLGDGTYDAAFFGWQATTTSVTPNEAIFGEGGINNFNGYNSPEVNDLFDELALSTDPEEQFDLQLKIEQELYRDAYGLLLFQFPAATIWDTTKVENVDPALLSPTMFHGFWEWEIPTS